MGALHNIFTIITSFLLFTSTVGSQLAERSSIEGIALEWELNADSCPNNTIGCSASEGGGTGCCPPNSFCFNLSGLQAVCCPTNSDCSDAVNAHPTCADPSWSLWGQSLGGLGSEFCCLPGDLGVVGGECVPSTIFSGTSTYLNIASSIAQGTGTATQATTTSNGGKATSTTSTGASTATAKSLGLKSIGLNELFCFSAAGFVLLVGLF